MRITNDVLKSTILRNVDLSRKRMMESQTQIATSKKINKPSDDPIGIAKALALRTSLDDIEQFRKNLTDGVNFLTATESALTAINDMLGELNSLTIRGADDSLGEKGRRSLASQVDNFIDQLVTVSNTRFKGSSIFGGTQTDTPPYTASKEITDETFTASLDTPVLLAHPRIDEDPQDPVVVTDSTGTVTFIPEVDYTIDYENGTITALSSGALTNGVEYKISYRTVRTSAVIENPEDITGSVNREIEEGVVVPVNVSGREVFSKDVDIFGSLIQLRDALERGDTATISSSIDKIDSSLDQVLGVLGDVGARINRLNFTDQRLEDEILRTSFTLSKIEDTNIAEAILNFETEKSALEAALAAGARIIQPSLINFLR